MIVKYIGHVVERTDFRLVNRKKGAGGGADGIDDRRPTTTTARLVMKQIMVLTRQF